PVHHLGPPRNQRLSRDRLFHHQRCPRSARQRSTLHGKTRAPPAARRLLLPPHAPATAKNPRRLQPPRKREPIRLSPDALEIPPRVRCPDRRDFAPRPQSPPPSRPRPEQKLGRPPRRPLRTHHARRRRPRHLAAAPQAKRLPLSHRPVRRHARPHPLRRRQHHLRSPRLRRPRHHPPQSIPPRPTHPRDVRHDAN